MCFEGGYEKGKTDRQKREDFCRSQVCPHPGVAVIKAHHLAGSAGCCSQVSVKDFLLGPSVRHSCGSVWGSLSHPRGKRSSNLAPILETLVNGGTTIKSFPDTKVDIFIFTARLSAHWL